MVTSCVAYGCTNRLKKGQTEASRPPSLEISRPPPGPECSGLCDLPGAENFPEDSPTKQFYKDKVLSSQEEITQLKKKVKTLQQTKRRLVKRNESAQEIIKEIREQKLLSEEGSHVFSSVFSDDIQQLLCRVGNEQKGKYPPELPAFALTLHFLQSSRVRLVQKSCGAVCENPHPPYDKERNREIIKDRVRPVLSRMIIFKYQ
ncbi:hypothetical protein MRX96_007930 [Rhipicephalus microplus]